uniref:BPTI/Kunitz inhibitor domain-containing protein n=1 Tax=Romanomermis culicivorax TaxID=13658 RepID=A0A915JP52_ROMCU
LCLLGKDSGPCDKFVPKWFFNAADGTCGRFYYGGCHGNKNRFDKLEECEERCAKKMDPCVLPPVPGPCSGTNVRFYWESNGRQCKRFNYGGCLGNGNRFETVQECQARCSTSGSKSEQLNVRATRPPPVFQPTSQTPQPQLHLEIIFLMPCLGEVCLMSVDPGTCHDYNYRFYFNYGSRRCEAFIYTGCGGNDNRFERVDRKFNFRNF